MKRLVSHHAFKARFPRDALQPDWNPRYATRGANAVADVADVATLVHG
jgi:hypothetical protein